MLNLIKEIADVNIEYILNHKNARAGVNGPYKNRDTEIRNCCHWIITYSYLWKITKIQKYYQVIEILTDFILKKKNYGVSGSVYARKDERFDKTNGLIGQAWVIEGLVKSYEVLGNTSCLIKAKELFFNQPFNKNKKLWDVRDCNGDICYDMTFNHQLWFAAAGAMILDHEYNQKIDNMIKLFLNEANNCTFLTHENGLIKHEVNYVLSDLEKNNIQFIEKKRKIETFKANPVKVITKKLRNLFSKVNFVEGLEQGYHLFDLYGFALLYDRYCDEPIFQSEKVKQAIIFGCESNLVLDLMNQKNENMYNKFSWAYNSPAFEYPYVNLILNKKVDDNLNKRLLEFQIINFYDKSKKSFCRNCNDPITLDARIYELVRYLEKREKL